MKTKITGRCLGIAPEFQGKTPKYWDDHASQFTAKRLLGRSNNIIAYGSSHGHNESKRVIPSRRTLDRDIREFVKELADAIDARGYKPHELGANDASAIRCISGMIPPKFLTLDKRTGWLIQKASVKEGEELPPLAAPKEKLVGKYADPFMYWCRRLPMITMNEAVSKPLRFKLTSNFGYHNKYPFTFDLSDKLNAFYDALIQGGVDHENIIRCIRRLQERVRGKKRAIIWEGKPDVQPDRLADIRKDLEELLGLEAALDLLSEFADDQLARYRLACAAPGAVNYNIMVRTQPREAAMRLRFPATFYSGDHEFVESQMHGKAAVICGDFVNHDTKAPRSAVLEVHAGMKTVLPPDGHWPIDFMDTNPTWAVCAEDGLMYFPPNLLGIMSGYSTVKADGTFLPVALALAVLGVRSDDEAQKYLRGEGIISQNSNSDNQLLTSYSVKTMSWFVDQFTYAAEDVGMEFEPEDGTSKLRVFSGLMIVEDTPNNYRAKPRPISYLVRRFAREHGLDSPFHKYCALGDAARREYYFRHPVAAELDGICNDLYAKRFGMTYTETFSEYAKGIKGIPPALNAFDYLVLDDDGKRFSWDIESKLSEELLSRMFLTIPGDVVLECSLGRPDALKSALKKLISEHKPLPADALETIKEMEVDADE